MCKSRTVGTFCSSPTFEGLADDFLGLGKKKLGMWCRTYLRPQEHIGMLPYVLSMYTLGCSEGQKLAEQMRTFSELHVPWPKVHSSPQTLLPPPHFVL